jgi:hypothetical protein
LVISLLWCGSRYLGNVLPDHTTTMNVLVFKTSVETLDHIQYLSPKLDALAGQGAWNFDLTDCDRILRIVTNELEATEASTLLHNFGFTCCELEDEILINP